MAFVFAVVSLFAANGGLAQSQTINKAALQQALIVNRAKWAAQGITSYILRQEVVCFCPSQIRGPFQITVLNGAITSASNSNGAEIPIRRSLETVDEAFDTVQRIINDPTTGSLEVVYDAALGYVRSYLVGGIVPEGVANEFTGAKFEILRILSRNVPQLPAFPIQLPFVGGGSLPISIPGLPLVVGGGGVIVPPISLNG